MPTFQPSPIGCSWCQMKVEWEGTMIDIDSRMLLCKNSKYLTPTYGPKRRFVELTEYCRVMPASGERD
jgi:hypothetical protein